MSSTSQNAESGTSASTPVPKVSVAMVTYNHEKFIAQAIEGVLMQETSFAIELIIGEDCSTDGTREIVRHYAEARPDIIRPLYHERNLGAHGNSRAVLEACRGEYIAFCEGDDYWTSPDKLQRQVDFLDGNPGCVMCTHRVTFVLDKDGRSFFEEPPERFRTKRNLESLLEQNSIATCSVLCRAACLPDAMPDLMKLYAGDWPTWILMARHGDVGFVDELMAAYRVHSSGAWSRLPRSKQVEIEAAVLEFAAKHVPPALRGKTEARSECLHREARRTEHLERVRGCSESATKLARYKSLGRALVTDPGILGWRPFIAASVGLLVGTECWNRIGKLLR